MTLGMHHILVECRLHADVPKLLIHDTPYQPPVGINNLVKYFENHSLLFFNLVEISLAQSRIIYTTLQDG